MDNFERGEDSNIPEQPLSPLPGLTNNGKRTWDTLEETPAKGGCANNK